MFRKETKLSLVRFQQFPSKCVHLKYSSTNFCHCRRQMKFKYCIQISHHSKSNICFSLLCSFVFLLTKSACISRFQLIKLFSEQIINLKAHPYFKCMCIHFFLFKPEERKRIERQNRIE